VKQKIGKNWQMKSLISWIKCNPSLNRKWRLNTPYLLNALFISIMGLVLALAPACQEKLPTLPYDKPLGEYDTLEVPANLIETRNLLVPARLGNHAYLYVGENEWVKASSLLRFANLSTLPDTLDSLLECTLYLFSSTCLLADSTHLAAPTIQLGWLQSPTVPTWVEDSITIQNYDLDQLQLTPLDTFSFASSDTIALDLTNHALDFLKAWQDTNQINQGFLLQLVSPPPTGIGCFYSRTTSRPPYLSVTYIENGDTLTRTISSDADAALLKFDSNRLDFNQHLILSAGYTGYILVKVNLDQLTIDKNWVVGDANFHLILDPAFSVDYNTSATIYLSLLDSADWESAASGFSPSTTTEVTHTLAAGSTVMKLNLPKTIQALTSGFSKNFGFVIWSSISSYNLNLYSIYSSASADSTKQPYLKLFLFKER